MSEFAALLEEEVDLLINRIQPTKQSNEARAKIYQFLRGLVEKNMAETILIATGSSCSRTYLPDGDLDLVMVAINDPVDIQHQPCMELNYLNKLFGTFCEEIERKEGGISEYPAMTIRNIEFVNARTKLLHCKVNNIGVDITFHQLGAIYTLLFLEEVDQLVGNNHLFKRSLLLVKTWCLNESAVYGGGARILGGKEGMFTSYAVAILVMYLFNKFRNTLRHPLQVLHLFLYCYQTFPWETHVLTLEGPKLVQTCSSISVPPVPRNKNTGKIGDLSEFEREGACENVFLPIQKNYLQRIDSSRNWNSRRRFCNSTPTMDNGKSDIANVQFPLRSCNIQDPIDLSNNLGYSVHRSNLPIIIGAMSMGYQSLESAFFRFRHIQSMKDLSGNSNSIRNQSKELLIPPPILNPLFFPPMNRFPLVTSPYLHFNDPFPSDGRGRTRKGQTLNANFFLPSHPNLSYLQNHIPANEQLQNNIVGGGALPVNLHIRANVPVDGYEREDLLKAKNVSGSVQPNSVVEEKSQQISSFDPHSTFLGEAFPHSLHKYILHGNIRFDLLDHPLQFAQRIDCDESTDCNQEDILLGESRSASEALSLILSMKTKDFDLSEKKVEGVQSLNLFEEGNATAISSDCSLPSSAEKAKEQSEHQNKPVLQISEDTKPVDLIEGPMQDDFLTNVEGVNQTEISTAFDLSHAHVAQPYSKQAKSKRKKTISAALAQSRNSSNGASSLQNHKDALKLQESNSDSSFGVLEDRLAAHSVDEYYNWAEKQLRMFYYPLIICFVSILTAILLSHLTLQIFPLPTSKFTLFKTILKNESHLLASSTVAEFTVKSPDLLPDEMLHSAISNLIEISASSMMSSSSHPQHSKSTVSSSTSSKSNQDSQASNQGLASQSLATYWVQIGDSITFGDFSLFLDYVESGNYPITADEYLWTKDYHNISTTLLPFYSIEQSTFEDAGHYRCYKLLSAHQSILLTESILRISKKPRIRNRPFYQEVKIGKTLVLNLDVEGVPPPAFKWYRNGYLLPEQIQRSLVIDRVEWSDAGTYSCEVFNIAGKFVWLEATINVVD